LIDTDAQLEIEDNVICTNCRKSKGECKQNTENRQEILEDEGKDDFMNNAYAVNNPGE